MNNNVIYAEVNQGIDSFMRVIMTLRRKEIGIISASMIAKEKNNMDIRLTIDEEKTSLDCALNHMRKLQDIKEVRINKS